jgi:hypothetical protein
VTISSHPMSWPSDSQPSMLCCAIHHPSIQKPMPQLVEAFIQMCRSKGGGEGWIFILLSQWIVANTTRICHLRLPGWFCVWLGEAFTIEAPCKFIEGWKTNMSYNENQWTVIKHPDDWLNLSLGYSRF